MTITPLSSVSKASIKFGAIPLASYTVKLRNNQDGKTQQQETKSHLKVFELEPKDVPLLDILISIGEKSYLYPNSPMDTIAFTMHNKAILRALKDAKGLLLAEKEQRIKIPERIYMAVVEKLPAGIAIFNAPKLKLDFSGITSSNRGRSDETELDWLVTWSPFEHQFVRGAGRILLATVYAALQKLTFQKLFIRSENEQHSEAFRFYQGMGCKQDGSIMPEEGFDRPRELTYILRQRPFEPNTDDVIPMIISAEDAENVSRNVFEQHQQQIEAHAKSTHYKQFIDTTVLRAP